MRSKGVATNTPPHGAFRGFGAQQSLFAMERHMDRIANIVGLSPEELRRRNFLQPGQTTTTEQVIREPINLPGLLDKSLARARYEEKRQKFSVENKTRSIKRGMGIAAF